MKAIILVVGIMTFFSLFNTPQEQVKKSKNIAEIKQNTDSVEYELLVFDSGFDAYLAKVPYSKDFYSNDYYKNWNIRYVTEWNIRAQNPVRYGSFYESQIDYQSNIDYGIDLNFKLYHYFRYVEDKHGIVLVRRKS